MLRRIEFDFGYLDQVVTNVSSMKVDGDSQCLSLPTWNNTYVDKAEMVKINGKTAAKRAYP
jgi:hypothetical protein